LVAVGVGFTSREARGAGAIMALAEETSSMISTRQQRNTFIENDSVQSVITISFSCNISEIADLKGKDLSFSESLPLETRQDADEKLVCVGKGE
jgi:hypothetical protein